MLRFSQKEKRADRLIQIVSKIACVFGNTHNFVLACSSAFRPAEVFSDRVFMPEKFPRKRLVDHGHMRRAFHVLLGDRAPSNDPIPDGLEVSTRDSLERRRVILLRTRRWPSIHEHAVVPSVPTLRRIAAQSHGFHTWNPRERITDAAIQRRELFTPIACQQRINIYNRPPLLLKTKILVFQIAERSCKQSGRGQQHQRKRRLHDNQRFPRQRARPVRRTVHTPERFDRIDSRAHPCRSDAERNSSK
jgi:hypothetical protein